jgi:hypothetical protein
LTPDEPAPDAKVRAKNRKALVALTAVCLVLASLGFLFARWLFSLPSVVKPGPH